MTVSRSLERARFASFEASRLINARTVCMSKQYELNLKPRDSSRAAKPYGVAGRGSRLDDGRARRTSTTGPNWEKKLRTTPVKFVRNQSVRFRRQSLAPSRRARRHERVSGVSRSDRSVRSLDVRRRPRPVARFAKTRARRVDG